MNRSPISQLRKVKPELWWGRGNLSVVTRPATGRAGSSPKVQAVSAVPHVPICGRDNGVQTREERCPQRHMVSLP